MIQKILSLIKSKASGYKMAFMLFIILGIILAISRGYHIRTVYVYGNDTINLVDTLTRTIVEVRQMPAKIDTVQLVVTKLDTVTNTIVEVQVLTEVARLDTLFPNDGRLRVSYYTYPKTFDVLWEPLPLEVRCTQLLNGTIGFSDPTAGLMDVRVGGAIGKGWKEGYTASLIAGVDFGPNTAYLEASKEGYSVGYMRKINWP